MISQRVACQAIKCPGDEVPQSCTMDRPEFETKDTKTSLPPRVIGSFSDSVGSGPSKGFQPPPSLNLGGIVGLENSYFASTTESLFEDDESGQETHHTFNGRVCKILDPPAKIEVGEERSHYSTGTASHEQPFSMDSEVKSIRSIPMQRESARPISGFNCTPLLDQQVPSCNVSSNNGANCQLSAGPVSFALVANYGVLGIQHQSSLSNELGMHIIPTPIVGHLDAEGRQRSPSLMAQVLEGHSECPNINEFSTVEDPQAAKSLDGAFQVSKRLPTCSDLALTPAIPQYNYCPSSLVAVAQPPVNQHATPCAKFYDASPMAPQSVQQASACVEHSSPQYGGFQQQLRSYQQSHISFHPGPPEMYPFTQSYGSTQTFQHTERANQSENLLSALLPVSNLNINCVSLAELGLGHGPTGTGPHSQFAPAAAVFQPSRTTSQATNTASTALMPMVSFPPDEGLSRNPALYRVPSWSSPVSSRATDSMYVGNINSSCDTPQKRELAGRNLLLLLPPIAPNIPPVAPPVNTPGPQLTPGSTTTEDQRMQHPNSIPRTEPHPRAQQSLLMNLAHSSQASIPFIQITARQHLPLQNVLDTYAAIVHLPLIQAATATTTVTGGRQNEQLDSNGMGNSRGGKRVAQNPNPNPNQNQQGTKRKREAAGIESL